MYYGDPPETPYKSQKLAKGVASFTGDAKGSAEATGGALASMPPCHARSSVEGFVECSRRGAASRRTARVKVRGS